jgi:hypothetical protein
VSGERPCPVITAARDEVLAWGAPPELDMAWTARGYLE